jgi:hypothetical protein
MGYPEDRYSLVAPAGWLYRGGEHPIYITSAIIRKLLTSDEKPSRMVLTIQQEVAERICAEAGEITCWLSACRYLVNRACSSRSCRVLSTRRPRSIR